MLNKLKASSTNKPGKRVGRGIGSGKGKTCGRGGKGQTARSGVSLAGFEGGQTPLYRRLPKRGFNNPNKEQFKIVNLYQIDSLIQSGKLGANITLDDLIRIKFYNPKAEKIKLLGKGNVNKTFSIEVHHASKKVINKVAANSSSVKII